MGRYSTTGKKLSVDIEEDLKNKFKEAAKIRCMTTSSLCRLFMERFIESPKEAIEFLFKNN